MLLGSGVKNDWYGCDELPIPYDDLSRGEGFLIGGRELF